ncbi:sulfotransferase domain-containing protein [Elusimicrobiota bacterium]
MRVLPDFIIIGGQRCGTTSLYNYLIRHPQITPGYRKEVHFFDFNFNKGIYWYRSYFPTRIIKYFYEKLLHRKLFTGEASPYYFFHPLTPKRIYETIPKVKLILLLRNPVDRAYSHYHHEVRRGRENLSFKDAIDKEKERLKGEKEKILDDNNYDSNNYKRFAYLSRGKYAEQIIDWYKYFPEEQLLIIKSEDFYENPQKQLNNIHAFLGLKEWSLKEFKKYNFAKDKYTGMDEVLKERLNEYFRPFNRKLYSLLKRDFGWDAGRNNNEQL